MAKTADPLLHICVLKNFPGFGYFSGEIMSFSETDLLYTIRYSDGEREGMSRAEVIDVLCPGAPCVFASVKFEGEGGRVLPPFFLKKVRQARRALVSTRTAPVANPATNPRRARELPASSSSSLCGKSLRRCRGASSTSPRGGTPRATGGEARVWHGVSSHPT